MIRFLVGGMLFLRIVVYTGAAIFTPFLKERAFLIYEIGTYLFTAAGIWVKRERLNESNYQPGARDRSPPSCWYMAA